MKVFVTGGSGFIGTAVVRHLLAANYEVRILARQKSNRHFLEGLGVEIIQGDLVNPESVERAVKGCSVVINLASLYTFYPFWEKNPKSIYKINVQGTINVLNAALKYQVQRFIHTSTIAAIGRRPDGKPSNEETGFTFDNPSHYSRSKYQAEQEVLKFCKMGLPAIILNPGIVFGERDYKPTPSGEAIVKFLNRSYPAYFDSVWSIADVDDIAKAHIAAITRGRVGERYILCNETRYSLKEIFKILEEISGIPSPRIKIPYFLLLGFLHLDEIISYYLFKKKPLMPVEGVKYCRLSIRYNNSKAVKELGFTTTDFKETLSKAVSWYRSSGYLAPRGIFRIKTNGSKMVRQAMKKIGMDKFTDKLNPGTLFFFGIVKTLLFLLKVKIKTRGDGWRMVTQSYLRTEHSKFCLAVFALDYRSDLSQEKDWSFGSTKKHIIDRFSRFLRAHPLTHWQLEWSRFATWPIRKEHIDIVEAVFNKEGNLESIELYMDDKSGKEEIGDLPKEVEAALTREIVASFNLTKSIKDKLRPRILKKRLLRHFGEQPYAKKLIQRILSATFIHFERLSADSLEVSNRRFRPPDFIKHTHPGFGLLNIVCRITDDLKEADLWAQFSHIPVDGVPMQEVLNDLKRQWGTVGVIQFPSPDDQKKALVESCSSHKQVCHINEFVDFRPLLKLRRELNNRSVGQKSGNITSAALFIWKLAHCSIFDDIKFAVPVDLPANAKRERTLGFVFIRPMIYFDRSRPDKGFSRFQREFNRQLRQTWKRKSEGYNLLEGYALTPAIMYSATVRLMPEILGDYVGTVGISIIKKADYFIAPASDVHTGGFIAISNFLHTSKDKNRVCNVSIKGPKEKIANYMEAIKEVAASEQWV